MSFSTDKKKTNTTKEQEVQQVKEDPKKEFKTDLLSMLHAQATESATPATYQNLTNRSVKIGVVNYEIMKRYAFETNRKLKDVLDEAIYEYVENNIDKILEKCEPSMRNILEEHKTTGK